MQLIPVTPDEFDAAFDLLEQSFPPCERRERADARALLQAPAYTLYHIEEQGERVGLLGLWCLGEMTFIEHFAIRPEKRNAGLGLCALRLLQETGRPLLLEAECPDTPLASRRLGFYARAGFRENALPYVQPPYHKGECGVPMRLLSWPHLLSCAEETVAALYRTVYGVQ